MGNIIHAKSATLPQQQHEITSKLEALGQVRQAVEASKISWFGTGGPIALMLKPHDTASLCKAVALLSQHSLPFYILGNMSNVAISDYGLSHTTIKLGKGFSSAHILPNSTIKAQAAILDTTLASFAAEAGLSGLEFLSTIPGSIGGAVRMNAGCFGQEIKDTLTECEVVNEHGALITLQNNELGFRYRGCNLARNWVIVSATFRVQSKAKQHIYATMDEMHATREAAQPTGKKTCGSTFQNPQEQHAWKLIQQANTADAQCGGAKISPKHSNFIINTGNATTEEIATLVSCVQNAVHQATGIMLNVEIEFLGSIANLPQCTFNMP